MDEEILYQQQIKLEISFKMHFKLDIILKFKFKHFRILKSKSEKNSCIWLLKTSISG